MSEPSPGEGDHLRQLALGQGGLLENLANGLAEPGGCASHLILVAWSRNSRTPTVFNFAMVTTSWPRSTDRVGLGQQDTSRHAPVVALHGAPASTARLDITPARHPGKINH
ncbi:MAG: hypothetical protein ACRDQY_13890 [Pseudonocardiaceae bacterium]